MLFFLSVLLVAPLLAESDDVLVSAPGVLKLGVPNNIVVHLLSSSDQIVNIEAYNVGNRVAREEKTVSPGSPTLFTLKIDATSIDGGPTGSPCNGSVSLLVQCPALGLNRQVDVRVECSGASLYIFTDKTVYTPGQTVSIRIACLDWKLTNYEEKLTIDIKNPTGIIVRRFSQTSYKSGLIDLLFTINNEPMLGWWTIEVHPEKNSTTLSVGSFKFEVKEYVVPRFGVEILSPDFVQKSTTSFNVTVRATYTYGKAVKGSVSIEFGALYEKKYRPVVTPGQRDWVKVLRDGEATFTINLEFIEQRLPYGFPNGGRLKVKARVTSDGVGLVEESTVKNTVFSLKSVVLDISKSRRYFKPGLPYDLEILARRPSGPPVERVDITLQAFVRKQGQQDWSRITFTRPNEQTRQTDDSGSTQFVFDIPQGSIKLKLQLRAAGNSWTETELFPEDSSQNRYLLIRDKQDVFEICSKPLCSQAHIDVYSSDTNLNVNLCHVLICRGVIMVSKCRSVSSWPTQVSLELRAYASPCCKLLVFYQLSGSFVADFTTVYSQMAFPNSISIRAVYRTNQPFYAPKDTMDFEISGIPGSTVYLTAVDEGVLLLGDNSLTALEVFNRLRGCSLGCDVRGGRDIDGIFKNAGLVYAMLSKDIDYNPICFPPLKVEPTLSNLEECCERGLMHCKDCKVKRQLLIDEDIHSDECVESFSKCCQIASQLYITPCNFQRRVRSLSQQNFQNAADELPTTHRSYFPESWLRDFVTISDRGVSRKTVNLSDAITTWRISALGISPTGLFGMAKPVSLRVFSPVFLEVSLPYSIVRNEQFAVKATVSNYNERVPLDDVSVELRSHSYDLCTATGPGRVAEKRNVSQLASKSSYTFVFAVVPLSVGEIKIDVILTTYFSRKRVTKVVRVEPEGIENEIAFSDPLDPSAHNGIQQFTYNLATPVNAVKDSSRSYFYVTGNLLGSVVALKGIDKLVRQPYGSGEHNMMNFCPNVIALIYLMRTGQLNQTLLARGAANIQQGYRRQLLFRRMQPPGSFSAFGYRDSHGSTWLTAFVLKCFCQVKYLQLSYEIINKTVIKTGLEWLMSQHLSTGEFEERGRVLDAALQGGVQARKCSLTAFVLIAQLECFSWDISVDLSPTVSSSVDYLVKCVTLPDTCNNTFDLAISGYALCLAKQKRASGRAIGQLWQCANVNHRSSSVDWVGTSPTRAVAVETSAYALLGFVCIDNLQAASLIANWLNTQRRLGGGFVSTQDTVIAIQALAAYAEKRFERNPQLTVTVHSQPTDSSAGFSITKQISATDANFRHPIPVNNNSIVTVTVTGSGTGLVQCGVKYNSRQSTSDRGFSLEVKNVEESSEILTLEISIRYNGDEVSGMAVAAIHVLPGFAADENSLKMAVKMSDVIKRYDNRGQTLNFYFEKLSNRTISFSIVLHRYLKVGFVQQAPIHVYDYYNPDVSATKFYAPGSESPLLALLCKESACQCGAGKCPYCYRLQGSKQRMDRDSSSCRKTDETFGKERMVAIGLLKLKRAARTRDFAYKFRVTKVVTSCNNSWTKVLGRIEKIIKPGVRDLAENDKIGVWKRADCSCPGFRRGQSYLYIGNDSPKLLVDSRAVVLKWESRAFRR